MSPTGQNCPLLRTTALWGLKALYFLCLTCPITLPCHSFTLATLASFAGPQTLVCACVHTGALYVHSFWNVPSNIHIASHAFTDILNLSRVMSAFPTRIALHEGKIFTRFIHCFVFARIVPGISRCSVNCIDWVIILCTFISSIEWVGQRCRVFCLFVCF